MPSSSVCMAALGSLAIWAGCDQVFGLTDSSTRDGAVVVDTPGDGPLCGMGAFGPPMTVTEVPGSTFDPQLRGDLRELFMTKDTGSGQNELFHMTRGSTSDPFENPELLASLNTTSAEADPAVTADGLDLFWKSDRPSANGPGTFVWEATRGSADGPWSPPQQALGMENTQVESLDVSADGLTLYYNKGGQLWEITRPRRDAAFAGPTSDGTELSFPSVSADGLEVFGNGSNQVVRRHRTQLGGAFGAEESVAMGVSDPDIAPDGRTLIVKTGGGTATMQRSCPP